jgi:hypothetical protein
MITVRAAFDLCGLRMFAAKNSRKRVNARSPAVAASAGIVGKLTT